MTNRTESAKWTQETQKVVGDLQGGVEKALSEAAGRGFPAAPGVTLATILAASQDAKGKLVEANGKIYDERRGVLFQEIEFQMGIIVKVAKLAMELYREELLNALAIEQSEVEALRDRGRADVERMNSETDLRQAAIIQARAEAEQQVLILKRQLVEAERQTLGPEEDLINAQLATAEKKLEIIDSIYQVLAAEELVLAAEKRRAASLQLVLDAERTLGAVKMAMVPFLIEKAEARVELAQAITDEIPVRKAIEELGYDRIALKTASEEADHEIRFAQLDYTAAQEVLMRATKATELARAQARRILQEYSNQVVEQILIKRQELESAKVTFSLDTSLARQKVGIDNQIAIEGHERANLTQEIVNILKNMIARATDHAKTVKDGAVLISQDFETVNLSRKIVEGFVVGPMATAQIG